MPLQHIAGRGVPLRIVEDNTTPPRRTAKLNAVVVCTIFATLAVGRFFPRALTKAPHAPQSVERADLPRRICRRTRRYYILQSIGYRRGVKHGVRCRSGTCALHSTDSATAHRKVTHHSLGTPAIEEKRCGASYMLCGASAGERLDAAHSRAYSTVAHRQTRITAASNSVVCRHNASQSAGQPRGEMQSARCRYST